MFLERKKNEKCISIYTLNYKPFNVVFNAFNWILDSSMKMEKNERNFFSFKMCFFLQGASCGKSK